ncbi:hypothetical protein BRADI_3g49433v3 [Brachypodium distachyon]|uniref:RNase H type-1 domain-containing protein n=1 Tax=Brachypodium distachyon TaxID=15368 RepID=A0A0Q3FLF9_BRADI|nr:hypothetical protein BRADI_3g49433v3 [Brachypodium distachyon]
MNNARAKDDDTEDDVGVENEDVDAAADVENVAGKLIRKYPATDLTKGKTPLMLFDDPTSVGSTRCKPQQDTAWTRPPEGWTSLCCDGSFGQETNTAGADMILRDEQGMIIFSPCRVLRNYTGPLEAEIAACMQGMTPAVQWMIKLVIA